MSTLRATNIKGRSNGVAPAMPDGVVVTGVCTATSFTGDVNAGIVTATTIQASSYVGVPAGFAELDAALFN